MLFIVAVTLSTALPTIFHNFWQIYI